MIVGMDIGYGYTKAVGGDRQVVFPSVVGKAERIRYDADLGRHLGEESHSSGGHHLGGEIALITEDGDHFVGELALLQSRVQWTLLDRSRVEDPSARLLFLAALSELVGDSPPLNPPRGAGGEEERQAPQTGARSSPSPVVCTEEGWGGCHRFRIVTGLPVNWYADRDKVLEQLAGKHIVRRVNGRQIVQRFTIDEVLVVPQPFGSLFDAILGPGGQIVDQDLAQGRVGVIDVGTYTTDYVLVDRLRYVERGSGTLASAMSRAYQLIGRSLLDTFGLDLRLHQVDRAVRDGQVTVFGEERNIDWLVDPVLDALSQEVLAEAGTLWGDGRDLKAVLVTGGGAMALGERIRRRYAHARVLPDAAMANVNGFHKYGLRKWREVA
jgi:plasmid segregation protein ParM